MASNQNSTQNTVENESDDLAMSVTDSFINNFFYLLFDNDRQLCIKLFDDDAKVLVNGNIYKKSELVNLPITSHKVECYSEFRHGDSIVVSSLGKVDVNGIHKMFTDVFTLQWRDEKKSFTVASLIMRFT